MDDLMPLTRIDDEWHLGRGRAKALVVAGLLTPAAITGRRELFRASEVERLMNQPEIETSPALALVVKINPLLKHRRWVPDDDDVLRDRAKRFWSVADPDLLKGHLLVAAVQRWPIGVYRIRSYETTEAGDRDFDLYDEVPAEASLFLQHRLIPKRGAKEYVIYPGQHLVRTPAADRLYSADEVDEIRQSTYAAAYERGLEVGASMRSDERN